MHVSFHKLVLLDLEHNKIIVLTYFHRGKLVSLASRSRFCKFNFFFNKMLEVFYQQGLRIFRYILKLSFFYSMEKILDRYERYSYAERQLSVTDPDSQVCRTISLPIVLKHHIVRTV